MPDQRDDPEDELVTRALDDADAFQALYQRYVRRIYGYVGARVANPQDAEDVVSEVFLRAIRHLDQLRGRQSASFAAWLFVIARSAIADHYRRDGRAQAVSLDHATAEARHDPYTDDALLLRQLIAALPERKREIVLLRYYGGLRNQEIAAVLGVGEKTVSAYLSRALDDLQAQYATGTTAEGEIRRE